MKGREGKGWKKQITDGKRVKKGGEGGKDRGEGREGEKKTLYSDFLHRK